MDKRYQVFVSSTYKDLIKERQEVTKALLESNCIPSGMELFPAADDDQWTLIKSVIDDCDYYIVIIAGRYGSIGLEGQSYTEMEYRYALSTEKPIIGFLHENPGSIPSDNTETSEEGRVKLNAFKQLVQQKVCKFWTTPEGLAGFVSRSINSLIRTKPAIGWVRANLVPDENSIQEILRLRRRMEELESTITRLRAEAPRDTTNLAQGETPITLHYKYYFHTDGANLTGHDEDVFSTTWNDVFKQVGTHLIGAELPESHITGLIRIYLHRMEEEKIIEKKKETYKEHEAVKSNKKMHMADIVIASEDIQTVKVQLRALGFITVTQKDVERGNLREKQPFWSLTPEGDNKITQLCAIQTDAN